MKHSIFKKEYSPWELLTEAWKRFTDNFNSILIIVLLVYIPINVIVTLLTFNSNNSFAEYLPTIIDGLVGILSTMAIMYLIARSFHKKNTDVKESMKKSLQKWPLMIGTLIMLLIFLSGLTLLLVIPGIIFFIYWIFTTQTVILEDKSFHEALKASKRIVKGRWWKVFGISLLFWILAFFVSVIIGVIIVAAILGAAQLGTGMNLVAIIIGSLIINVVLSFFIVLNTVFYLNYKATEKKITEKKKKSS